jgi:hypothetical protein
MNPIIIIVFVIVVITSLIIVLLKHNRMKKIKDNILDYGREVEKRIKLNI